LWDTAGQERFKSVVKSHYRDADAVILVYDAQNALSLQELDEYWLDEVRRTVRKDCGIYVFANKCDIAKYSVSRDHREWFAREKIKYFEVSAKTGRAVHESITALV
jgi:small GTP-binding protein